MPIKIKSPLEKQYHLEKSDKELGNEDGATMVTIRQATQGDFELVNDLNSEFQREYDGTRIIAKQRISFDDIRRLQVFLTMIDCNILDENEKDPLFRFDSKTKKVQSRAEFERSWYKLPPVIADEIYEYVLEMNPLWDDRIKKPDPDPTKVGEGEGA